MRLLISILLLVMPLMSCGCNLANRATVTGVCVDIDDTSYKIKDLYVTVAERICDSENPTVITDENGRFSIDQCFEEDDEGENFSVDISSFPDNTYKSKTVIYEYKGQSVIDLGEIPLEKY